MEVAKKKDEKKDAETKKQNLKILKTLLQLEKLKSEKKRLWNIEWEVGEFLNFLTSTIKPKNTLEFGTSNGFSTIWLSINSKQIYTLESRKNIIEEAKLNFKKANINNIKIIEGPALESIKKLKKIKFDLIFIDANKEQYIDYIKYLEKNNLLSKKSIIIADNILSHQKTTKKYTDHVMKKYNSFILKIGKGLCITKLE